MKTRLASLIVILFISVNIIAQSNDGWQQLFDGKTLNGWHIMAGTAEYSVEDGAVVGKNRERFAQYLPCM